MLTLDNTVSHVLMYKKYGVIFSYDCKSLVLHCYNRNVFNSYHKIMLACYNNWNDDYQQL